MLPSQLLIGGFIASQPFVNRLGEILKNSGYTLHWENSKPDFLQWVGDNRHRIDCLLLESVDELSGVLDHLLERHIFLPAVVLPIEDKALPLYQNGATDNGGIEAGPNAIADTINPSCDLAQTYHGAIACLPNGLLDQLDSYIHQAIDQFLKLPHQQPEDHPPPPPAEDTRHFLLSLQQERLTEKLRERLGYLGVYYKRNPQNFLKNLTPTERAEIIDKLRSDYRAIVLNYFADQGNLNQIIDDFVNVAFFSDVSISQIVEVHMELMDDFAKQLKLEGRNEEILLDYRLTLIDVIAHLCEMYRRSIPARARL
ncbi:MAG: circadian clock protein KaiA [Leptolyngbya sp. RL_3_1]|nr:circadian clock protein KaiA [Leptolyngbya sp. RL_3_1]